MMCVAALAVACSEDDDVAPEAPLFPAVQTYTIATAGENCTFTLQPNLDWIVSIPTTAEITNWFYLDDGGYPTYSLHGKAGESVQVVVATNHKTEFDVTHTVDVSLTMGGQTEVVATITLGHDERQLTICPVMLDDEGYFMMDTDGYQYDEAGVSSEGVTMVWPEGMSSFQTRLKVTSNFGWMVANMPAWVQAISKAEAGVTELWLQGNARNYPLQAASEELQFVDAAQPEKVVATMKLSIPGAANHFATTGFAEITEFNYEGLHYNELAGEWVDGTVNGSVCVAEGAEVVTLEFVKMGFSTEAVFESEWLTATLDAPIEGEGVLQDRTLRLSATVNEGYERSAYVLVIPRASLPEELWMISTESGVAPDFEQYLVTTVRQQAEPGPMKPVSETALLAGGGQFGELSADQWLPNEVQAPFHYDLLYTNTFLNESSDADLLMRTPYAAALCYGFNAAGSLVELAEGESWLEVVAIDEDKLRIKMYPELAGKGIKNENTGDLEGYILFRDAEGNAIATLLCRYNPQTSTEGMLIQFAYPQEAADYNGSSLVRLTGGDDFLKYNSEYGAPVYQLTFTSATPNMSMLTGFQENWIFIYHDDADSEWLKYEYSEEYQVVTMNAAKGNGKRGALIFKDAETGLNKFVLICELNVAQ